MRLDLARTGQRLTRSDKRTGARAANILAMKAAHIADLARSPSELTEAELIDAIRYWQRNRSLVSADAIEAIAEEFGRRLAVSLGAQPLRRGPQQPTRTPSVRPALFT